MVLKFCYTLFVLFETKLYLTVTLNMLVNLKDFLTVAFDNVVHFLVPKNISPEAGCLKAAGRLAHTLTKTVLWNSTRPDATITSITDNFCHKG